MKKQLLIVLGLGMILTLAGCQNVSNNKDVDPRIANNESIEFFSKSGITACAAGAATGALACLVANANNKPLCIAAAAIAGCGIGIGTNAYLDNNRKKYATKELQLNAMTADMQKENANIQNASKAAKSVIADDKVKLAQIDKDMKAKRLNKAAAEKELKGIDANIAALRSNLADMKKHEKNWKDISAQSRQDGIKTAQLDKQISDMSKQVRSLEQELDSLYGQRTAIKLS
ncbi:hypothetical protein [Moellerella wisconsensis]|uniref:hypothetical protein n=1 Tax=Moellerella wisconsensis TaxID=158849 RepID=UPI003076155F